MVYSANFPTFYYMAQCCMAACTVVLIRNSSIYGATMPHLRAVTAILPSTQRGGRMLHRMPQDRLSCPDFRIDGRNSRIFQLVYPNYIGRMHARGLDQPQAIQESSLPLVVGHSATHDERKT